MINLAMNELQSDLVSLIRDVAASTFPVEGAVSASKNGAERVSDTAWLTLAESGIFGLTLSEESGGIGLGSPEEYLVFVELGRATVPGPVVGTSLAAKLASDAGSDLAEELTSGARRAGLVVGDLIVDADPGDLAVAVDTAGATIYEVASLDPAVASDPLARIGRGELVHVLRVEDPRISLRFRLLVGGYAIGLAEISTTNSVEYAKTREQFGKPIGAFQAVKHRCSEMVIRSYPARVQLGLGSVLLDTDIDGAGRREIASGHVMAVDAAVRNAEDNIQNHGGIGFTAEARPGIYLKRAMTYSRLAGDMEDYADEILSTSETVFS